MIRTLSRVPDRAGEPPASAVSARLATFADASPLELWRQVGSSPKGLTEADAAERLADGGRNGPAEPGALPGMAMAVRSPFVGLLACLGVVFAVLGEARGALTVAVMVALSVGVRFWQHGRSRRAVAALREQVCVTATVRRRAAAGHAPISREVPIEDVVPGDVVELRPGDLVPADLRLLRVHDLMLDQSALSGEALPVSKQGPGPGRPSVGRVNQARWLNQALADHPALCLAGTSVVSGTATAVVIATGDDTYAGSLAGHTSTDRAESSFDRGVRAVGWTLIRFMLVLAPVVLLVKGGVTGDWSPAVMFALAVAVGLTPEMLPVIVTTNLTRGALRLARAKVIVKRLNAIQDLGAIDVLCVDKTGSLTEDRVVYAHSINPFGQPDGQAAEYAYLALRCQVGPGNRLDEAMADQLRGDRADDLLIDAWYQHVDEVAFDPYRRRATVVVRDGAGERVLICRGDPEVVLERCSQVAELGAVRELTPGDREPVIDLVRAHGLHGMRLLAVAIKHPTPGQGAEEDSELTLVGFVGFVDPVRAGTVEAVRALDRHGVAVKVLTGDSERVAEHVCARAGIPVGRIMLGEHVERASDAKLRRLVTDVTVFAKLSPAHKARVVAALRDAGHAVGFLGDGVNDAPALRHADVGIAADTATDVAKDAADLILLDKDLAVLADGILEGRRTLGNTLKYVHITASSNFGNVLSVLAASVLLPFLPMLPIQLMAQNLLYDAAQLALPWDRVDPGYLRRPRRWDAAGLTRFMLVFGPLSSLFDLATFALLWWVLPGQPLSSPGVFHGIEPAMFQTGWFVEGLCSQLLAVLVLRAGRPMWRAGRPARPVLLAALAAALAGLALPVSPLAAPLGMHALAGGYLGWLAALLVAYGLAAELAKRRYLRRRPAWW